MKVYYDNDLISDIDYLIMKKRFDIAQEKILDYQEKYPNDTRLKITILKFYNSQEDYEKAYNYAIENKDTIFRDNQSYAKFYSEFSACLMNTGRVKEAISYLEYAFSETGGRYYHIINLLGDAYSMNMQYNKAIDLYKRYLNSDNRDFYYLNLCKVYYLCGDFNNSIKYGNEIRDDQIKSMQLQKKYYYLGKANLELCNYKDAEICLKNALTNKNKKYFAAYYCLAKLYVKTGRIDEATKICEEMIRLNTAEKGVYALLSRIYNSKKDVDKTKKILDNFDNDEREFYLGELELRNFNFEEAIIHFNNYLESGHRKHNDYAFYNLIIATFRLGRYRETLDLIDKFDVGNRIIIKDLNRMKFYSKYVLGEEIYPESYTAKQIINYSEKEAINHIFYRHILNEGFKDGVDVVKLFDDVKNKLDKDKLVVNSSFDTYRLDFDNLGEDNYKKFNTLSVVCLPNTKNILTMYPAIDANIENDELDIVSNDFKKEKKVKLSRTQMFNQKYAKFLK